MTTTDREPLYQQAYEQYRNRENSIEHGIRAVVDLALDARPDRQPFDVLQEAQDILADEGVPENYTTMQTLDYWERALRREHKAAQEKAAAEAAREKLIEQAARIQCDGFYGDGAFDDRSPDDEVRKRYIDDCARLYDAGLLSAPTTDGGGEA